MGHLAKECLLSRKVLLDVANDEPQTSVGGPWVQVAKRHMIKKTSHGKSKWQPKDNIYNLLMNVGEGQTQLMKDLEIGEYLTIGILARRLWMRYNQDQMILKSMFDYIIMNTRNNVVMN